MISNKILYSSAIGPHSQPHNSVDPLGMGEILQLLLQNKGINFLDGWPQGFTNNAEPRVKPHDGTYETPLTVRAQVLKEDNEVSFDAITTIGSEIITISDDIE